MNLNFLVLIIAGLTRLWGAHGNAFSFSPPDGCPIEYGHDASDISPEKTSYKIGDKQRFRCDAHGDKEQEWLIETYSDEHLLYPASERECLPDGKWSSPLPKCIQTSHNILDDRKIRDVRTTNWSRAIDFSEWKEVGIPSNGRCFVDNPEAANNKHLHNEILEKFLHVHLPSDKFLSFLELDIHIPHFKMVDAKVLARGDAVLHYMSEKARLFKEDHYTTYFIKQPPEPNEQSVKQRCSLDLQPLNTKELLIIIKYRKEKTTSKHSDTRFHHPVRKFPLSAISLSLYDIRGILDDIGKCPDLGSIPNARVYPDYDENDEEKFRFACNKGYAMFDPVTNTSSDGFVRCLNNESWIPSPLPVCRALIYNNNSGINSVSAEAAKSLSSLMDDQASVTSAQNHSNNLTLVMNNATNESSQQVNLDEGVETLCISKLKLNSNSPDRHNRPEPLELTTSAYNIPYWIGSFFAGLFIGLFGVLLGLFAWRGNMRVPCFLKKAKTPELFGPNQKSDSSSASDGGSHHSLLPV